MVDWTKPLELVDGTPVRLILDEETGETDTWSCPDRDGDYWIEREDLGKIVSVRERPMFPDYSSMCVHPNGCEEGTGIVIVRNRAAR